MNREQFKSYCRTLRQEADGPLIGACAILKYQGDFKSFVELTIEQRLKWVEFKLDPPYCFEEHLSATNPEQIRRMGEEHLIGFSMHAPHHDVNIGALNHSMREASVKEMMRCIDYAAALGCKSLTIHCGDVNGELRWMIDTVKQNTVASLKILNRYCQEHGLVLSVENGNGANRGRVKVGIGPEEILAVISQADPGIGLTLDLGHANLSGVEPLEFLGKVDPERINVMHVHDNLGQSDQHLPVGDGLINYPDFVKRYLAYNWNFPLAIESHSVEDLLKGVQRLRDLFKSTIL